MFDFYAWGEGDDLLIERHQDYLGVMSIDAWSNLSGAFFDTGLVDAFFGKNLF